jgi:hypothetical protein
MLTKFLGCRDRINFKSRCRVMRFEKPHVPRDFAAAGFDDDANTNLIPLPL